MVPEHDADVRNRVRNRQQQVNPQHDAAQPPDELASDGLQQRHGKANGAESGCKEFYLNGVKLDQPYVAEKDMKDENEVVVIM